MSDEPFVAVVPDALGGVRVDRAVAMLTGVPRSVAARLVSTGQVRLGGQPVTGRSMLLVAGAELAVTLPDPSHVAVAPDPAVPFTVVYEDPDLVVVDKPAGVVVHPGAGRRGGTLVGGLVARYPDIARLGDDVSDPARPGIVHRIDRGTSGLLVVARTPAAFASLASQMAARTVGRRYLALVAGHVGDDRGLIDAPVGRSTRTPTRMAVTPEGRPARTAYVVVVRLDTVHRPGSDVEREYPSTLLACTLETGRTHQIRVHMAAIGHPVVGDDRYGVSRGRVGGSVLEPGRLFLHAAELAFDHPSSGRRVRWSSPLPSDLAAVAGPVPGVPDDPAVGTGPGGG